jgi:hypothetical protein
MARGNWRSGKEHGTAEVGSTQKIIDGWVLRKSGSFDNEKEANNSANILRNDGYVVYVVKGRIKWNVWRTYRRTTNHSKAKY